VDELLITVCAKCEHGIPLASTRAEFVELFSAAPPVNEAISAWRSRIRSFELLQAWPWPTTGVPNVTGQAKRDLTSNDGGKFATP
jgi:hypothetical protein